MPTKKQTNLHGKDIKLILLRTEPGHLTRQSNDLSLDSAIWRANIEEFQLYALGIVSRSEKATNSTQVEPWLVLYRRTPVRYRIGMRARPSRLGN
ncbi:hypothetical protein RRG08_030417 [Elysia crispata]|uniref:Uncharacterized protein n=1 Tax=Elysia crispata TaxID=231223 RepID=A0AAE1CY49_9GAST|nr:hypothetical protein RRG08_030417 [Elysia crispata]